ncbi:MAG: DUF1559 domain-containing protein [Phycisphaeraceae bacterium]|nr:DUF1559 domain-containing protein [Phycisphaeraceae bacterium]
MIELLVVISIIALLIAILLPALKKARDTTRQVQCLSNFRQIGMGLGAYLTDYKDQYPPKTIRNGAGATTFGTQYWLGRKSATYSIGRLFGAPWRPLNRYVGGPYYDNDDEVPAAQCPSDILRGDYSFYNGTVAPYGIGTSYRANNAHNKGMNFPPSIDPGRPGRQANEIHSPSLMIAMFESRSWEYTVNTAVLVPADFLHTEYNDNRWNTLFADTHAEMIEYIRLEYLNADYSYCYDNDTTGSGLPGAP